MLKRSISKHLKFYTSKGHVPVRMVTIKHPRDHRSEAKLNGPFVVISLGNEIVHQLEARDVKTTDGAI